MDPYLLLEVPHTANIEEIKKAYRRLAKKWHPDKNGGDLDAAEMFRKVKAAYDCLVDPIKREAEDLKFKHREQAKATKPAKRQAGQWASAQSKSNTVGVRLPAIGFIVIALIVFLVVLFGSDERNSHPSAAV